MSMTIVENDISHGFFKEEEICGHLVTEKVKKLWAIEIGCLEELKRICNKHDIRYFASGGTLLGAVRHKGFIPWDDDLDVVMFKEDYERFCEVAPKEVQYPYFFQNYKTEKGAGPGMSRIRNSETTGCTQYEFELASDGYNCGIFLDIFPMFGVEENWLRLMVQKCEMLFWRLAIGGYEHCRKIKGTGWSWRYLIDPSIYWWKIMNIFTNHEKASGKYLKVCGKAKNYSKVGLLSFTGFNPKLIWDKGWYDEIISMPFEYTQINCPKRYDLVLKTQFGNYMEFVKGGSIHTMAVFDPDIPYHVILKDNFVKLDNKQLDRRKNKEIDKK